jgi:hypothetical protein
MAPKNHKPTTTDVIAVVKAYREAVRRTAYWEEHGTRKDGQLLDAQRQEARAKNRLMGVIVELGPAAQPKPETESERHLRLVATGKTTAQHAAEVWAEAHAPQPVREEPVKMATLQYQVRKGARWLTAGKYTPDKLPEAVKQLESYGHKTRVLSVVSK